MRATNKITRVWTGTYLSLTLTGRCIDQCSASGSVDADVAFWAPVVFLMNDNQGIMPESIRKELKEFGAWDEKELMGERENEQRIVWIAACDLKEETKS
jgi:uncharacterized protein YegL